MTQWSTRPSTGRMFLLRNGDVISEPAIEQSGSNRRVRLADNPDISRYSRDSEGLLMAGLTIEANKRGTEYWMPIVPEERYYDEALVDPQRKLEFDPTFKQDGPITAWWKFKHRTLPLRALIAVQWSVSRYNGHMVQVTVTIPDERPKELSPNAFRILDNDFDQVRNAWTAGAQDSMERRTRFRKFIEGLEWASHLGLQSGLYERQAVEELFTKVRHFEELLEITVPSAEDRELSWLTFRLEDTNVTNRFMQDVREYLDGTHLEGVREAYENLVKAFRQAGMVVSPGALTEGALAAALHHGNTEALTVSLGKPIRSEADRLDHQHELFVHLPTGTLSVSCSAQTSNPDQVSLAWEESLAIATLTGRKDALLAYADEYAASKFRRDVNTTIQTRSTLTH